MEDNKYPAIAYYDVFILHGQNRGATFEYMLESSGASSFNSYEEAKEWIEDNGKRHLSYTIITVFKKS